MIRLTALLAAFIAISATSFASPCTDDVAKLEQALKTKQDLAADVRAQAEDMVKQAKDLCTAGNDEDGLSVASEAKALLGVE